MDGEKIFANSVTDKRLIPKIYEQFIQLYQKNKQPNQKIKQKFISLWKLDNTFVNNQWMKEEITREIIKLLRY